MSRACREKTEGALAVLEACIRDEGASWRDRMTAAVLLIEHAHGKQVGRKVVAELGDSGQGRPVEYLTKAELLKITAGDQS